MASLRVRHGILHSQWRSHKCNYRSTTLHEVWIITYTMLQFGAIVIAGFGYSNFNTILVSLPISVFTFIWVVMATIITSKFRKSRCITAACLSLMSLAGCLMVSQIDPSRKVARLAGMWLFPAYSAGIPIMLSIIASNVGGYTKRTTVSAVVFIGNCAGNITGPFLFFSDEMPNYRVSSTIPL